MLIKFYTAPCRPVLPALRRAMNESRFVAKMEYHECGRRCERRAKLNGGRPCWKKGTIDIWNVRLRASKDYCGSHAGPCPFNPVFERPHSRRAYLEGADWVEWNDTINDVLDWAEADARVWNSICLIRQGLRRRVFYDGRPDNRAIWCYKADDEDYQDYSGTGKRPASWFPSGTPGIYRNEYNAVG